MIQNNRHDTHDTLVRDLYGPYRATPIGEVGLEVEVEDGGGERLPVPRFWWSQEFDGSLRGNSCEYVLKKPIKRASVAKAVKHLKSALRSNTLLQSNRTSVHVHINMLRSSHKELFNMITLYTIFENVLVRWCGESRVGNHFCLRLKDAHGLLRQIENGAERCSLHRVVGSDVRYAALNVAALKRFGSLEFRSLRGTVEPAVICDWVNMLLCLKDYSKDFSEPMSILMEFSSKGPVEFANSVFGSDIASELLAQNNALMDIQDGMWMSQSIAGMYEAGSFEYRTGGLETNSHTPPPPDGSRRSATLATPELDVPETLLVAGDLQPSAIFEMQQAIDRANPVPTPSGSFQHVLNSIDFDDISGLTPAPHLTEERVRVLQDMQDSFEPASGDSNETLSALLSRHATAAEDGAGE